MNFLRTISLLLALLLCASVNAYPRCSGSVGCGRDGRNEQSVIEISSEVARTGEKDFIPQLEQQDGPIKSRQKRLSDQRRAELETLVALSKMTARLIAVSRSGRHLDPAKIGR